MRVKKDLKDLNPNNLDFPEGTRLFINDIMCPYYKVRTNIKNKVSIRNKNDVCLKNISKEALHAVFQKYRLNAIPKQLLILLLFPMKYSV